MPVELVESEKKLSQEDIAEFERQLGVSLPKDFVDFYYAYNGGYIPESEEDEQNPYLLNSFLTIKYGKSPIEEQYQDIIEYQPELKGLVPFAYDDFGSYFLISTKREDFGKVYIKITGETEIDLVSNSFSLFLSELTDS